MIGEDRQRASEACHARSSSAFSPACTGWRGTATLYVRNLTTGLTIVLLANGEDADLWSLERALEKWLG